MTRDIHIRRWSSSRGDAYWSDIPKDPGYWLQEERSSAPRSPTTELIGDCEFDIVIVGGGFAGLWIAYFLAEASPDLRLAVVEASTCGSGASGRNAGFVTGWWDELETLIGLYGPERALVACKAIDKSINEIGEWCRAHEVNAWYRQGEYLAVGLPSESDQLDDASVRTAAHLGSGDSLRLISKDEVGRRIRSPLLGSGFRMPVAGTVHPARLAGGIRRVLLEKGVTIYENSPAVRLGAGSRVEVTTRLGRVRAPIGVVAMGAWGASLWPLRRLGVTMASYVVATEPVPEFLEEIGWVSGECVCDLRKALHYFRTTPDGRIVFGGGATRAVRRNPRTVERSGASEAAVAELRASITRFFPGLPNVRIVASWGGPVDFSPIHLPMVDSLINDHLYFVYGFSGNGVAPAHAVARELVNRILGLGAKDTWVPNVGLLRRRFPVEPIRSFGVHMVQEALVRQERNQDNGKDSALLRSVISVPRHLGYHF